MTTFAQLIQAHFASAARDRKIDGSEMARAISLAKDAAGTPEADAARAALSQGVAQYRDRMDASTAGLAENFLGRPRVLPRVDELVMSDLASAIDPRKSGGLSAQELASAEAETIAKNPGFEADVSQAMRALVFTRGGELTTDGAAWYRDKYGSMDGHVARYQQILNEHQRGAVIVDSNGNNELDASDRITSDRGSVEIGQETADELKVRGAIVNAAHDMNQAGHRFLGIEDAEFSKKFFEPEGRPGTFQLKDGVKPSEAIQDMFVNPENYGFECATGAVVTYYKAMLDVLGPEAFDRTCKDLVIGPWKMEGI